MAAASAAAIALADNGEAAKRSPQKQLAIARIYKDKAVKELTLERQKVKEVTRQKNKLQQALIQVNSALQHEHGQ